MKCSMLGESYRIVIRGVWRHTTSSGVILHIGEIRLAFLVVHIFCSQLNALYHPFCYETSPTRGSSVCMYC